LPPELERAAGQGNQTNNPSKNEVGPDVSHHTRIFPRGGEVFLPDILGHRMSAKACKDGSLATTWNRYTGEMPIHSLPPQ
jgi:hypothetical protein